MTTRSDLDLVLCCDIEAGKLRLSAERPVVDCVLSFPVFSEVNPKTALAAVTEALLKAAGAS